MTLNFEIPGVKFNIDIPAHVVAIYGDSGTGKTLLVKAAKATKAVTQNKDYLFFDYSNDTEQIVDTIKNSSNKIIFIDNADLFIGTFNWRELLHQNNSNTYIVFTRDLLSWGIPPVNAAKLIYKDGTIYTDYLLRK